MLHRRVRFLIIGVLLIGLMAGSISQWSASASAQDGEFHAAAVVIASTGAPGRYSFPEAPGYPPASCIGSGSTIQMYEPGYISVAASSFFNNQKVSVTEYVYQRFADGTYAQIAQGNSVDVYVNIDLPVAVPVATLFSNLPIGPDYVLAYHIDWRTSNQTGSLGTVDVAYSLYHREYNGTTLANSSVCGRLRSTFVGVNTSAGVVGSYCYFTLEFYPLHMSVPITWDGKVIGSVMTGSSSFTDGSFKVPASTLGAHSVHWKYGHWDTKITYTVKSSIKLAPSSNVLRGQIVHVYLRGYAAHETVNVRWIKNGSFVTIAQVTTSGTGTANVDVHVPTWVPNGSTKVRGDGTSGHAQTNSVTVSGGPFSASTVKTPTPTPIKTATSTPSPTAAPTEAPSATTISATSTPEPIATNAPGTPEPIATDSPQPTESATPAVEPTEIAIEQATATVQPTSIPGEEATATAGTG
jgi:hypothetical protein